MNFLNIRSHLVSFQNLVNSISIGCCGYCPNQRCQVHPVCNDREDLDFVRLDSQRVIRVIHLSPNSKSVCLKPVVFRASQDNQHSDINTNLDINSEEYWFTVANRPFRQCDDCHRVFTPYRTTEKKFPNSSARLRGVNELATSVTCHPVILTEQTLSNIEQFADIFSQEVMKEVFLRIITGPSEHGYVESDKNLFVRSMLILKDEHYYKLKGSTDETLTKGNPSLLPEIARSWLQQVGNMADGEPMGFCGHENTVCDTTSGICSSGFVNHSFTGSLTEPDQTNFGLNDMVFNDSSSVGGQTSFPFDKSIHTSRDIKDVCSQVSWPSIESRKNSNCSKNVSPNEIGVIKPPLVYMNPKDVFQANHNKFIANQDITHNLPFTTLKDCSNYSAQLTNAEVKHDTCPHSKNILKPLMLFLHGVGSSADIWSVLLDYFSSAGYEVLAPDMLGHGYSTAPDDRAAYTFEKLLEDVLQIFDRFVSDHQRCVVIGHSYGSCFAAALARYRPQQIAQLVLLSSGGPSPLVPKQSFTLPSFIITLLKPFLMCGFKRELFYAPRGKHLPSYCTYELPPYVLEHIECGQDWADGDSAFHRRILIPTLLVHGLRDPHISLVEECEMERTIPRSFLEVLPNSGHMLMQDAPEQLCHMLHCFVTWWNS